MFWQERKLKTSQDLREGFKIHLYLLKVLTSLKNMRSLEYSYKKKICISFWWELLETREENCQKSSNIWFWSPSLNTGYTACFYLKQHWNYFFLKTTTVGWMKCVGVDNISIFRKFKQGKFFVSCFIGWSLKIICVIPRLDLYVIKYFLRHYQSYNLTHKIFSSFFKFL